MYRTKKIFRIIIIFLLFVLISGCSKKYLVSTEEKLISRAILSTWEELDANVIEQNDKGFSLNLKVKDFIEAKEYFMVREFYKRGFKQEDGSIKRNVSRQILSGCATAGCSGCLGTYFLYDILFDIDPSGPGGYEGISTYICGGVGALCLFADGCLQSIDSVSVKTVNFHLDTNSICVDSVSLLKEEIKIMAKNMSFEKMYYTDKKGYINLKFDEIIPKPTEADSILGLIIKYEEMVDTVDVRFR